MSEGISPPPSSSILRWALLTLPLVLDHRTMHLGPEPIFHSDMYFLHAIPNERRITHVFVSLNAAPTKVWACASSKDCQLEDISGFLVNHGFTLLPSLSTFSALIKGGGGAGLGWSLTCWLVWVLQTFPCLRAPGSAATTVWPVYVVLCRIPFLSQF